MVTACPNGDESEEPAAATEPAQPTLFRSDTPPTDLEGGRDAFGHKAYATALASALREAEAPFTFGLFGAFGLGKTTVIDELRRQLKGDAAVVVFDAWRYEGDELRRQFLRETARSLENNGELTKGWTEKHLAVLDTTSAIDEEGDGLRVSRAGGFSQLAYIAFAALLIYAAWRVGPQFGTGKKEWAAFLASVLIAIATYAIAGLSKVFYVPTRTVTQGELKPELFSREFSRIIGDLKKSDRLVVVIDNLDRCGGERMEAVFFTLSTFLEPLSLADNTERIPIGSDRKEKDAVFVIAADDEALRKHLNAKVGALGGDYADDFLRKLFKASLSMKQLLADDMRDFVATELADFCNVRRLEQEDKVLLVELVSAALKRNPRRIREFANNLELHLRVIEARESGDHPQIDPKISGDVLLVAKIRLIEEEWPALHGALYDDPRRLEEWYGAVARGQYGAIPGGLPDDRFVPFMGVALSIPDRNLRALLRLKQSREELRLPRFIEFHEGLREGQADLVREIVTADGADVESYAARLREILLEESGQGYLAAARNVVEVALLVDPLSAEHASIGKMLRAAAEAPALREELRNTRAVGALFQASMPLGSHHFNLLMEPWVRLNEFYEEGPERAGAVVEALEPCLGQLNIERRTELTQSLTDEKLQGSIATYLPLVDADPEIAPDELGTFALKELGDNRTVTSEAFRLYSAWIRRSEPSQDAQDSFASFVAGWLGELGAAVDPDSTEVIALSDEECRVLSATFAHVRHLTAPETVQSACAAGFETALKQGTSVEALLDLCHEAFRWKSPESRSAAGTILDAAYVHSPDELFEYSEQREPDRLSEELAWPLQRKMAEIVKDPSVESATRLRAAALVARLDPKDKEEELRTARLRLLDEGDWDLATELLKQFPDLDDAYTQLTVEHAMKRVEAEGPAIASGARDFLEQIASTLTGEDHIERLQNALDRAITEGTEDDERNAAALADRLATQSPALAAMRKRLLGQLFDSLSAGVPPSVSQVRLLVERAHDLDSDRRSALISQLRHWVATPGTQQLPFAGAVAGLVGASADERYELVDAMVDAETAGAGDPTLRLGLLNAANNLRGRRNSRADKRLADRLKAIAKEDSEENKALLSEIDWA